MDQREKINYFIYLLLKFSNGDDATVKTDDVYDIIIAIQDILFMAINYRCS